MIPAPQGTDALVGQIGDWPSRQRFVFELRTGKGPLAPLLFLFFGSEPTGEFVRHPVVDRCELPPGLQSARNLEGLRKVTTSLA